MMELTYPNQMLMPASYTVLSEEEMTYIEGGAIEMSAVTANVLNFTINVAVNAVRMLGRGALNSAMSGLQEMHDDGMGLTTSVRYFWDGQNTRGKVSAVVMGSFAGFYAYLWARQTINTVVSVYKDIKAIYDQTKADKAAKEAAAAAIPNNTLAVA